MKREEELKPCPFCGSNAHVEQYGDARQSTKYQCDNCGCMLETGEEWGFGRDWNRRALLSTPKLEPVGWETDAEWDLEMRCANITENTPFAEVSKLINDLWQQYCLAAEPKPEAEGVDHQVQHSKPVVSQNTKIVERDIYEVANQLGGYVGPDTPERLKRFLLKEEKAAAALADEIVRLRSELAKARSAAMEGWQPIETMPTDREFLAFGYYFYPGDKAPTVYTMIAEISLGDPEWPYRTHEGTHRKGFFSHWCDLPKLPEIKAEGESRE
ncbi:Lar family restriction alleviation protein [Rhizobium sp. RHZ02]|uniref:Lar family restriction alleviation protein n=1 Tax=Rhizobium sp. RHZ02 TaxID=2769306 RepID=UPI001786B2DF|nr:Lar family restriction alleviation protein [Rhizobium sp. RHZ02]MBD9455180.1 Lar family restriction alleviation protein [Rhizobium sp. RHZ02]